MRTYRSVVTVCVWLASILASNVARAWTFPEHTRITHAALHQLANDGNPDKVRRFHETLAVVRQGLDLRMDADGDCVSYSVLPSLAADHSCTPDELRRQVSGIHEADNAWILEVLEVARGTGHELASAGSNATAREEARRQMHVSMQLVDTDYVQRALVDYSHFQVAREDVLLGDEGLTGYLALALSPRRESNALAAYANYHVAAVRLAAHALCTSEVRQALLTRAFLAEAFALHFLQDAFSAGHFVGHWGDAAVRLGSHDYYSGAGFEAVRWGHPGVTYVAHGDGFLSDHEMDVVAGAVSKSLFQVIDAGTDEARATELVAGFTGAFAMENYDSCTAAVVPPGLAALERSVPLREVVKDQPVPSRRSPEVPRIRAENGFFFGAAVSFQPSFVAIESSLAARVLGTIRMGYGAAGLVNDPLNSQLFFDLGPVGEHLPGEPVENLVGWSARARIPAFIIPGDGLLGIPLALIFKSDCPFCVAWAAAAGGGGAFRIWKARRLFGDVRGQISAFRDVTVNYLRTDGQYRLELLMPFVTARLALPMGGSEWSQLTDFYLDLGPSLTWTSEHHGYWGGFLSFSAASRVFP